jgi:hypothetical protein
METLDETGVKVNDSGVADRNAGENADDAGQPQTGVKSVAAGQITETEAEKGLKLALEAERKKRQQKEQEAENLQRQFQILQISQQQQPQPQQPQRPQSLVEQLGILKDDLITGEQVERILQTVEQNNQQQRQQSELTKQQQIISDYVLKHPDYSDVVGQIMIHPLTKAPVFVPAEPLKQVISANPALANLSDPIAAYEIAKAHQQRTEYEKQLSEIKEQQTQQNVNLKTNPMPSVAAGGAGNANLTSQLESLDMNNPADRAKFAQIEQKIMGGR